MFFRFQSRFSSTLINVANQIKSFTDVKINETLNSCIELKDFKFGREIHQNLSLQSMENPLIQLNLIRFYFKCGDIKKAQEIFNRIPNKTSIIYNTMIKGLADNEQAKEALKLFQEITIPINEYLLSTIFKICTQIGDDQSFQYGKSLWKTLPVLYENNIFVLTSALHMFMQNGHIFIGEQIFKKMKKDLATYGTMMSGYVKHNQPKKAIEIFMKIKKPDEINLMLFFNACAQLKNEETFILGKQVFHEISNKYNNKSKALSAALNMFIKHDDIISIEIFFTKLKKDIVCYNSLMKMYIQKNETEKILDLFQQMKRENIKPNEITFVLIVNACAQIGDLSTCQLIILQIPKRFFNNIFIRNALIDMWGKSGSLEQAKKIFEMIQQPDVITFGAMINSYGLNGMGIQAVELFRQVPFDMLNEKIYVCVLNACSHSSSIEEARQIFDNIPINEKTNRIYATMIDVFSRSYFINEAQKLIDEFEQNHLPYLPMYMSMLSAARNQRNISLSQKIFDEMKLHFPDEKDYLVSATILLANTYALNNDFTMASNIRTKLNQSGMKKVIGLSSTVINGKIIKFRAHDRSHPKSKEIYAEWDRLMVELIQNGYKYDSSWMTRPIMGDDSVESVHCGHSERLAILLNLIEEPTPSRIQVTQNLCICDDCHEMTQLIAKIRQCEIIIRDANRIHHFYPNGKCSCQIRSKILFTRYFHTI